MATFAERLKEELDKSQLSQAELAERIGVNRAMITHYLHGKCEARADVISKMARVFGCTEAWLMGYDIPLISEEEDELLLIFRKLSRRSRIALLAKAYELDDAERK
ncbi:MAG: helix-turn-helix domain-containing protein [Fibrobacter sp.]|nr:helix-turn-helix domain-containing protein [Fibrobacter sp.]